MKQSLIRAAATSALALLASVVCLVVAYANRSALTLDMDRELPRRTASGVYPPERVGDRTFAWTSRRAEFRFRGVSRDSPWACSVEFRGARQAPVGQPMVDVAIDGIILERRVASNDFERIEVTAPSRPNQPGLSLTIAVSDTVVPGPSDPRELGVQIDRIVCRPTGGAIVTRPPRAALEAAVIGAVAFGAALGLCLSIGSAAIGAVLVAAGQALPLASGVSPYSAFPDTAIGIAIWIALAMFVTVKLLELNSGGALTYPARFVVAFSAAALYLKLLGLLHPSKLVIDALFHAHRFQAVLAGDYYFTQIMPSGVTFPYAIGLYVVAAPWAALTRDHVMLLRIVVSAAEVVAGALLYLVVVRAWTDRLIGALAVVLFHTVALPYALVGNANQTNAFGQSVALITLVAAASWSFHSRNVIALAGLFLVASLAFLSHISTAALLGTTLVSLAVFYWWLGGSTLRASAAPMLVVTILAAAFAWGIYYGRFTEVYLTALQRVRATSATSTPSGSALPPAPSEVGVQPPQRGEITLAGRTGAALHLTVDSIGWPIVLLAIAGVWQLWRCGARDRLGLLVAAWAAAYVVFLLVGIGPRVEGPFQRYAAEFVGRVVFATYPAVVILAARGAAWGLRAGLALRLASLFCVMWTLSNGVQHWRNWFE